MNTVKILLLTFLVLIISCTENNNENEIIINISDFETTIDENPIIGELLGMVDAITNLGSLTFSIIEQSPNDAIGINSSTGEIMVLTESLFDFETNPTITGVVRVENGETFDTINIIIHLNDVKESLKSITLNKYNNDNELTISIKRTFQNERLIAIENSFGITSNIETYENGLIKKRESNNSYDEYFYDDNNRLIKLISNGSDGVFINEFIYNGNLIKVSKRYENENPDFYDFELNSDNLIYKELRPGINNQIFESIINYQNENPSSVNLSYDGFLDTYEYNLEKENGIDVYNFYKYIYGTHWKNNLLLANGKFSISTLNYYSNVINYISTDFITQYQRVYSDGSFFGYTINYEFDNHSNLLTEIKEYIGDAQYRDRGPKKIELIYEYE